MIELRSLTDGDIVAHNAGEDAETVRWLSGTAPTEESTRRHFAMLAENEVLRYGKQGFGIWLDDRLAGYIDFDDGGGESSAAGDLSVAYAVHPWARRRGVATAAVGLLCAHLARERIGRRAVIRVAADNVASMRVAERCGFRRSSDPGGHVDPSVEVAVFVRHLHTPASGADTSLL